MGRSPRSGWQRAERLGKAREGRGALLQTQPGPLHRSPVRGPTPYSPDSPWSSGSPLSPHPPQLCTPTSLNSPPDTLECLPQEETPALPNSCPCESTVVCVTQTLGAGPGQAGQRADAARDTASEGRQPRPLLRPPASHTETKTHPALSRKPVQQPSPPPPLCYQRCPQS